MMGSPSSFVISYLWIIKKAKANTAARESSGTSVHCLFLMRLTLSYYNDFISYTITSYFRVYFLVKIYRYLALRLTLERKHGTKQTALIFSAEKHSILKKKKHENYQRDSIFILHYCFFTLKCQ